jgi:hypothetical protein
MLGLGHHQVKRRLGYYQSAFMARRNTCIVDHSVSTRLSISEDVDHVYSLYV